MRECPECKLCFPDDVQRCPNDGDQTFHSISGEPVLDGRYVLIKRLGQGGMGVVYRARHSYLKTNHAIKVILPDLVGNDPMLVTRFRQEALAAAAIRHRNIVNVTDFGVAQGTMPFLVMEFVEGESLHDLLLRETRLEPQKALDILAAICSGLSAAHRQGIVHRDLKPLNIMIQNGLPIEDAVKILDFGLAKIKSGELLGSFIQAQTTGLMGSPYYMAPEQWSDEDPEAAADVYSLGVMLHQMLIGEVPFRGASIPAIMKRHMYDAPPSFAESGVNLAPEIERAVCHALEKDRTKRTPSVEALVNEFRAAVTRTGADVNLKTIPNQQPEAGKTQSAAAGQGQPVATLRVITVPSRSQVFLDGKLLGTSKDDGWLVVEGVRQGQHKLRVTSEGFSAWESQIDCNDEDFQIVAQLQSLLATNVSPANVGAQVLNKPSDASDRDMSMPLADSGENLGQTQPSQQNFGLKSYPDVKPETRPEIKRETKPDIKQGFKSDAPEQKVDQGSQSAKIRIRLDQDEIEVAPKRKTSLLPFLAAFIFALIVVVGGGYGAYRFLFAPPVDDPQKSLTGNSGNPTGSPTNQPPVASVKADMVEIPGGTFKMGRNSTTPQEGPEHSVTVKTFFMDKTEVTNQAYAEFVQAEKYAAPSGWNGGAPPAGDESKPVGNVSVADAEAFAKWRSKRDGVEYRLPTEEEWEYAARNGSRSDLYPWGNNWENGKAVVKGSGAVTLMNVGSFASGANQWKVVDLIGNVHEWTASKAGFYRGSPGEAEFARSPQYHGWQIVRGGSIASDPTGAKPISATFRDWFAPDTKHQYLGFRLVRSAVSEKN